MKTKTSKKVLGILVLASLFVAACDKKDDLPENVNVDLEELAMAETEVDNLFQEALEEIDDFTFMADYSFASTDKKSADANVDMSGSRNISTTVKEDGTVVMVIDYDNFVNPRSRYEREKNGRIRIEITGRPLGPRQFMRKIIFDNFKVGKYTIEGTKTIERDTVNLQQYHVKLLNGKVTFEDGTLLLIREFQRTITWRAGSDTPYFIWDDVYTVEGQGRGMTRDGREFSNRIIEPLVVKRNCRYIVSGIIEIKLGDREAIINYGEGEECSGRFRFNANRETRVMKF